MKVLFLQSFGEMGSWIHRLKRQTDLMAGGCDLKVMSFSIEGIIENEVKEQIKRAIEEFNPDVLYIAGFLLAYECLGFHDNIVFDMGSWFARNILIDEYKLDYADFRKMSLEEIRKRIVHCSKEREVIQKAKAIIVWESEEAELIKKVYDCGDKLHQISMLFYNTPEPIPFEKKKDRVLATASKLGKKGKNVRAIYDVNLLIDDENDKYFVQTIGEGGNLAEFMPHEELMNEMNQSKVIFCPYVCGGIGVVNEGLKMGCNVVVDDWYPYRTYTNDEITISSDKRIINSLNMIKKAIQRSYPLKRPLPSEKEQLGKVMAVLKNLCKEQ